ncbi:MAG: hypothetical protein MR874_10530 [Coriobacteriaceae bacterium]|nr:hypothetical protein [Coriobacteriaceae bacterium]MCI6845171.1 hypothetical protein [Coriobacteriaceae bacterium]
MAIVDLIMAENAYELDDFARFVSRLEAIDRRFDALRALPDGERGDSARRALAGWDNFRTRIAEGLDLAPEAPQGLPGLPEPGDEVRLPAAYDRFINVNSEGRRVYIIPAAPQPKQLG